MRSRRREATLGRPRWTPTSPPCQQARATLNELRAIIRSTVPAEATEVMSYAIPAFRYKGVLVCYGAAKRQFGFYPMSAATIVAFHDELKDYSTSKGTIRFPLDRPLPAALVSKIVRARVAQNKSRQNESRKTR